MLFLITGLKRFGWATWVVHPNFLRPEATDLQLTFCACICSFASLSHAKMRLRLCLKHKEFWILRTFYLRICLKFSFKSHVLLLFFYDDKNQWYHSYKPQFIIYYDWREMDVIKHLRVSTPHPPPPRNRAAWNNPVSILFC